MSRYVKVRVRVGSPNTRGQLLSFSEIIEVQDNERTLDAVDKWQKSVIRMNFEELENIDE